MDGALRTVFVGDAERIITKSVIGTVYRMCLRQIRYSLTLAHVMR